MHLKYSLFAIAVIALLSQASGEEARKWMTASEAIERTVRADTMPEEEYDNCVVPMMEEFNDALEEHFAPKGEKATSHVFIKFLLERGEDSLHYYCVDPFVRELEKLGFRVDEINYNPVWIGQMVEFKVAWGEEEKHLKEDNNHDRCEKEASDLGDLQDTKDILASLMKTAGLGDIKESNRIADDMLKEIDRIVDNMMKEIKQYDGVKSDFQKFDAEFDELIKSLLDDEALDDDDE